MICLQNFYQSFTILAIALFIIYLFVCLPDNSLVLKTAVALILSFTVFALIAGIAPDYAPVRPFTAGATYVVLIIFFGYIASGLSESFLLLGLLVGCLLLPIAAQDNLSPWFQAETGIYLSENAVLGIVLGAIIVVAGILYYFQHNKLVWDIFKTLFFSFLGTLALRIIEIVVEYDNPDEFCCSVADESTCPVYLDWFDWIIFGILILLRYTLMSSWRERKKILKKQCNTKIGRCCCCLAFYQNNNKDKEGEDREEEKEGLIKKN
jgi:hypothetical protein